MKKIILMGLMVFSMSVFAVPREIIIIRHADKLPDVAGPFLSPKGQVRAQQFVSYYVHHFPEPDFIFASKPANSLHPDESDSVRPLQTVAPLANQLTFLHKKAVIVHFPYFQNQYPLLAKALLHQKKYNQKIILICWQHGRINFLAQDLGVERSLPFWDNNNYDQVYILKYGHKGKLISFSILKNQYPVVGNFRW